MVILRFARYIVEYVKMHYESPVPVILRFLRLKKRKRTVFPMERLVIRMTLTMFNYDNFGPKINLQRCRVIYKTSFGNLSI